VPPAGRPRRFSPVLTARAQGPPTATDLRAETPASLLGLLPRHLHRDEILAWRQDWGDLSIHPMSRDGAHTVRDRMTA